MTLTRARTRLAAFAALAVALCSAATFTAPSAQAHDQLVSSSPAADAVLTTAPATVDLVYSEEIVELGIIVEVVGADGENWVAGSPTASSTAVTAPLRPGMPEGAYELRWRVVSSDGHPIDGISTFTVTPPETDVTTPVPSLVAPETEAPSPAATPAESSPVESRAEASDAPPMATTIAVGAVLLLVVVAVALIASRIARARDRTPRP